MLYVQQSLGPDERLVHIGRFHWFYNVSAASSIIWGIAMALALLAGAVAVVQLTGLPLASGVKPGDGAYILVLKMHPGIKILALLLFILGLLKFAQMMVIKATTEIAITTNRVIYKRGLVARYVGEISIDRIEGVNVLQSFMGRIFNYGSIIIRGMGVGEVFLPPIADPLKFRKAIEYARTL